MSYNPSTFILVLSSFVNRTNLVSISRFPQFVITLFFIKTDDENNHQLLYIFKVC